jgi:hypothetical protein
VSQLDGAQTPPDVGIQSQQQAFGGRRADAEEVDPPLEVPIQPPEALVE